jgi:hypothetical protein
MTVTDKQTHEGLAEGAMALSTSEEQAPPVFPLLPTLSPGSPLAIIDIDCDDRGDGVHTGDEMVFDTTRRMRLATGAALLVGEQGNYIELPPRPQPTRLVAALLAVGRILRITRTKRLQTNWDVFFDPALLCYDQLNERVGERIDALERTGWGILFLTSLPDSCFEERKRQMIEAGLLRGAERGLICKPASAQFLRTKHWKALVVGGTRTHHLLEMRDKDYRLLPDLLELFPWMLRGLLEYYKTGRVLYVDDEAENRRQVVAALQWFPPQGVESLVFNQLSQLDSFLESGGTQASSEQQDRPPEP